MQAVTQTVCIRYTVAAYTRGCCRSIRRLDFRLPEGREPINQRDTSATPVSYVCYKHGHVIARRSQRGPSTVHPLSRAHISRLDELTKRRG